MTSLLWLLVLPLAQSVPPPVHLPESPSAVNLNHNASRFGAARHAVAFLVPESQPGTPDLNGDGDRNDLVIHVTDSSTGDVKNLGLATSDTLRSAGRWVVFAVHERGQGATDLNGDGDTDDRVLHVYDSKTSRKVNLRAAVADFEPGEELLCFEMYESDQGEQDLNGDGDTDDGVLHVVELSSMRLIPTHLATGPCTIDAGGRVIAFGVGEFSQGHTDLNGDGDANDLVLHIAFPRAGTIRNLGRAIPLQGQRDVVLSGTTLTYQVDERAQQEDTNGDGDLLDLVLEVYDHDSGLTFAPKLASDRFSANSGAIALRVPEEAHFGADLNGDGDANDHVLFVGPEWGPGPVNLGFAAARFFELTDSHLVFLANESEQGSDLNGDGDVDDQVAHVHDRRTALTTNLGLACFGLFAREPWVALRVSEFHQAGRDLNGNGQATDSVLHLLDLRSRAILNTEMATSPNSQFAHPPDQAFVGGYLAVQRLEYHEGRDLNGDGDALDPVVHLVHLAQRRVLNLRLASGLSGSPPAVITNSGTLLFRVSERSQGDRDLNGDGDTGDRLLHAMFGLANGL